MRNKVLKIKIFILLLLTYNVFSNELFFFQFIDKFTSLKQMALTVTKL